MRVLVVDDEEPLRRMMRLTLEAAGHETGEARDGESGLALYERQGPWDAVLLDQRLPGVDGLETLSRLRGRDPSACVIMVTAYASVELAVDAMKLGATDFVRKPMMPETLRAALAAAVAKRQDAGAAPPSALSPAPPAGGAPPIETLTMNGFRIRRIVARGSEHRFGVRRYPGTEEAEVLVVVRPEAVERVNRLTRHDLRPDGGFWSVQAERALADRLWSQGALPAGGRLEVADVSRDEIDVAAAWTAD